MITLKDLEAKIKKEQLERKNKPFYIRILYNIRDLLRRISFYDIKIWLQRTLRGYSDLDADDIGSFVVRKVRSPLKKYVKYEEEDGLVLPNEFQSDPAAWLEILKKIEKSFDHEWREDYETDYDPYKDMTQEQISDFNGKIQEGFELFGRYLRNMWN